MSFILLNSKLEQIKIVEEYESIIWTIRYYEAGEFELYSSVDINLISILSNNKHLYLWSSTSDRLMYITGYEIETTFEEGSKLIIHGRSLEYILNQRIIWDPITFSGSLNEGIRRIIYENVINPNNPDRKIHNIYYEDTKDPSILGITVDFKFHGDNVYESVVELCKSNNVGIKMVPDLNDHFIFSLYSGTDHSYDQTKNSYVVFSSSYENLGSSNFISSTEDYRNVTEIVAVRDDKGNPLKIIELNPYNSTGMDRYEMLTDVNDDEKEDSYYITKGYNALNDHKRSDVFEGQVEATKTFVYGVDFNVGDIVQIENEYGMESKSRVTELVLNQNSDVFEMYPAFEAI